MLTSLDFLQPGQKWTPKSECKRLEKYHTNMALYEGNFSKAYYEVWQKIKTRYGLSNEDLEQVMIPVQLFQCLVEVYSDLTLVDNPVFKAGDNEESEENKKLADLIKRADLTKELLEKAFIDAYSMGNGIFRVSRIENQAKIDVITPDLWFPVVQPDNKNNFTYHVIAWKWEESIQGMFGTTDKYYLKAEIHERGRMTERLLQLDNAGNILKVISEQEYVFSDDWPGFLVFPFNFGAPSWKVFGLDNFTSLISLVEELIVRLSNNSKILDEHAAPKKLVTDESLEMDPVTGLRYLPSSDTLLISKDGHKPEYLTWDGNLNNSEVQMSRIMDLFYMISGTNPQIFGKDLDGNLSGAALQKIFMRPLAKANRYIKNMHNVTIDVLKCAMALEGVKNIDISAEFKEASFESIDDISSRMEGQVTAGIRSKESAVKRVNPDWGNEQIDEEIQRIQEEQPEPVNFGFEG